MSHCFLFIRPNVAVKWHKKQKKLACFQICHLGRAGCLMLKGSVVDDQLSLNSHHKNVFPKKKICNAACLSLRTNLMIVIIKSCWHWNRCFKQKLRISVLWETISIWLIIVRTVLCLDQSPSLDTQRLSHCHIIIYEGHFRKSSFIFMKSELVRNVELRIARVPGLIVDDTL